MHLDNLRKSFCLTILSAFLFLSCSFVIADTEPRIINGEIATFENIKHQVSIRLKSFDSPFGNGHVCGGSLIGPKKVLTAAHCVYDISKKKYRSAKDFRVVLGTLNRFQRLKDTIVSDVTSIAITGTFNIKTMVDDVALLFLKYGLPKNKTHTTIEPIALNNATLTSGQICQVSGWGRLLASNKEIPADLHIARVPLVDKALCTQIYNRAIKSGMLCAGYMAGGTDACQGDSGGPLVCNNTLVGVVSWGNGCGEAIFPGVYTDVSYYKDWISNTNASGKLSSKWSGFIATSIAIAYSLFS